MVLRYVAIRAEGDNRARDGGGPCRLGRCACRRGAPHAGKWKITGGGGFTVSKDRRSISGLHLSGSSCGLRKISGLGKQRLRLISAGGVSNWIVGFSDPKRTDPNDLHGVVGQTVGVRSGKKTLHARLDVVFAVGGYQRGPGTGQW